MHSGSRTWPTEGVSWTGAEEEWAATLSSTGLWEWGGHMTVDPASTPRGTPVVYEHARSQRHTTAFTLSGVIGALVLIAYGYSATRWGPLDDLGLLIGGFALLLVGFSVLAVFGVRARVIAPFVVAALLLPWAVAGAAFVGSLHRVVGAVDEIMGDSQGSFDGMEEELAPSDESGDVVEPAPEDQSEIYETPPDGDVDAVPVGEPVPYTQLMGPGEADVAEWVITVQPAECGMTVLPDADYSGSGDLVDAVPREGFEFCLIASEWANVGDVASWPMPLGNLVVDGEQIFHEERDVARGFAMMDQRGIASAIDGIAPDAAGEQIDVYEVPSGSVPESVWITRDDPQALAATA